MQVRKPLSPADSPSASGIAPPARPQPPLAAAVAATLAWWREAGVDSLFEDEPRRWLAPAKAPEATSTPQTTAPTPPTPVSQPAPAPIRLGGPREAWPTTLPAFHAWWLTEPSLDHPDLTGFAPHGATQPRIPPRGPDNPPLMVIVPQPEEGDTTHLLSGPQGRLLAAIVPMLGFSEAEMMIASALPRPMPLPDWPALAASGLGAVLLHHVALVAPRRIIAFGSNVLPLLSHAQPQNTVAFPPLNHEGFVCPLLPAGDLAMLLERPAAKARFWQHWLEFSGSDGAAPHSGSAG